MEFTNTLKLEAAPNANDPLCGGNELLWQLTGGTETMRVTRIADDDDRRGRSREDDDDDGEGTVLGRNLPVLPNNHGPQTDRLIYKLGAFRGYDSGDPSSRENGLYDQPFVDTFIHRLSNGGRIIAGQFDDPYQLDEKGIFDLVNLTKGDLGGIAGARRDPAKDVFTGFNLFSIALEVPITDLFPGGIPHNGQLRADFDRQPAARVVEHRPAPYADRGYRKHYHRSSWIRRLGAGGPQCAPVVQRRAHRNTEATLYLAQQSARDV